MSIVAKHIRHYNALNGKPVNKTTVQKFLAQVKGKPGLEAVEKGLSKLLTALNGKYDSVEKLTVKPIPVPVKIKTRPGVHHKSYIESLEGVDKSFLFGLEHGAEDPEPKGLGFTAAGQQKIYDMITDMVLTAMKKAGGIPWRKPWQLKQILATNFKTKTVYKGANLFMMNLIAPLLFGKDGPWWLTFKQVKDMGGTVKKGATAFPVIYYNIYYAVNKPERKTISEEAYEGMSEKERAERGATQLFTINYYNVFAQQDIAGIKFPKMEGQRTDASPIDTAQAIVDGMPMRPPIHHHRKTEAYYRPVADDITVPEMNIFKSDQEYYSTLFHEMVHSTGHESRLNRFKPNTDEFGEEKEYAFEELIAEMGASYLNAEAGTLYFTLKNSATYIKGWQKKLEDLMASDNKFFLRAAAKAAQATDFILNRASNEGEAVNVDGKSEKVLDREKLLSDIMIETGLDYNDLVMWRQSMSSLPDNLDSDLFITILKRALKKQNDAFFAVAVATQITSGLAYDVFTDWRKIIKRGGDISDGIAFFKEYGIDVPSDLAKYSKDRAPMKREKKSTSKMRKTSRSDSGLDGLQSVEVTRSGKKPVTALAGFTTADKSVASSEKFQLPGVMGKLLGKMQRYKLLIIVPGETHSGKSEFGKQIANAFAAMGDNVAYLDWEQGGLDADVTVESINRNIDPENRNRVHVSGNYPKTIEALKELADHYQVVVLDSGTKLKMKNNDWIDELRESRPNTVWIILMQQNAEGGTKGGVSAEFDAPVVIFTYRPNEYDYTKNYAKVFKNRGNQTGIHYLIAEKKIVD